MGVLGVGDRTCLEEKPRASEVLRRDADDSNRGRLKLLGDFMPPALALVYVGGNPRLYELNCLSEPS